MFQYGTYPSQLKNKSSGLRSNRHASDDAYGLPMQARFAVANMQGSSWQAPQQVPRFGIEPMNTLPRGALQAQRYPRNYDGGLPASRESWKATPQVPRFGVEPINEPLPDLSAASPPENNMRLPGISPAMQSSGQASVPQQGQLPSKNKGWFFVNPNDKVKQEADLKQEIAKELDEMELLEGRPLQRHDVPPSLRYRRAVLRHNMFGGAGRSFTIPSEEQVRALYPNARPEVIRKFLRDVQSGVQLKVDPLFAGSEEKPRPGDPDDPYRFYSTGDWVNNLAIQKEMNARAEALADAGYGIGDTERWRQKMDLERLAKQPRPEVVEELRRFHTGRPTKEQLYSTDEKDIDKVAQWVQRYFGDRVPSQQEVDTLLARAKGVGSGVKWIPKDEVDAAWSDYRRDLELARREAAQKRYAVARQLQRLTGQKHIGTLTPEMVNRYADVLYGKAEPTLAESYLIGGPALSGQSAAVASQRAQAEAISSAARMQAENARADEKRRIFQSALAQAIEANPNASMSDLLMKAREIEAVMSGEPSAIFANRYNAVPKGDNPSTRLASRALNNAHFGLYDPVKGEWKTPLQAVNQVVTSLRQLKASNPNITPKNGPDAFTYIGVLRDLVSQNPPTDQDINADRTGVLKLLRSGASDSDVLTALLKSVNES